MIIQLISILHLVHLAASLVCWPCCTHSIIGVVIEGCVECPEVFPSNCTGGQLTKDQCGCCDVCAKAVGESCGYYNGRCGDGLYCYYPPPKDFFGVCCCEKKILKETEDVYILDKSSNNKTLDICLDECVYRKEGDVSDDIYCFKKGNSHIVCDWNH